MSGVCCALMPRARSETVREVARALGQYEDEVQRAGPAPNTVKTYLLHARNFVRWPSDDFTPGETLPPAKRR